jgi:hypothetical protein
LRFTVSCAYACRSEPCFLSRRDAHDHGNLDRQALAGAPHYLWHHDLKHGWRRGTSSRCVGLSPGNRPRGGTGSRISPPAQQRSLIFWGRSPRRLAGLSRPGLVSCLATRPSQTGSDRKVGDADKADHCRCSWRIDRSSSRAAGNAVRTDHAVHSAPIAHWLRRNKNAV